MAMEERPAVPQGGQEPAETTEYSEAVLVVETVTEEAITEETAAEEIAETLADTVVPAEDLAEAAAEADESEEELIEELSQVMEESDDSGVLMEDDGMEGAILIEDADEDSEQDSAEDAADDSEDDSAEDFGEEEEGDGEEETEKESGMGAGKEGPRMLHAVGIRFRVAGRVYYFLPGDLPVKRHTAVIVETSRGPEFGICVSDPIEVDRRKFRAQLKKIDRIATKDDIARQALNRQKEVEAKRLCRERIRKHGLEMKLIDAEYTFDNSKLLFYFTADQRVDFRDLVKDLAGTLHVRIELRQIGVRDETKILGGYGICGRPLCCNTYLADFAPVSIKMAKEQNLSLNPAKISGVCGRLLCCLKNEADTYEELNRSMPRPGDEVESIDGLHGEVESVSVLRQKVRILVDSGDEKELHEVDASDVNILRRRKRGQARPKARRDDTVIVRRGPDSRRSGTKPAAAAVEENEEQRQQENTAKRGGRDGARREAPAPARRERPKKEQKPQGAEKPQTEGKPAEPAKQEGTEKPKRSRRNRSGRKPANPNQNPNQNQNQQERSQEKPQEQRRAPETEAANGEKGGNEARSGENRNGKNRNRRRRNRSGQGGERPGANPAPKPDAEA